MARPKKSFQRGSVAVREYGYGTAYILRYRVRDPDGGWIQKSETLRECQSKKAALRELARRLEKPNQTNGGLEQREPIRFGDLLSQVWPAYLDNKGIKPSTRYSYESMIEKWIRPEFETRWLGDVTPADVGAFMSRLSGEGLSTQYRRNIYNVLKLLFDLAQEYGWIDITPVRPKVHRPQAGRRGKSVFSVDRARKVLRAVDEQYRLPILTLALTGLRVGELLGVRWQDLDLMNRRLTISGSVWRGKFQTTKTESSDRKMAISQVLCDELGSYRDRSPFRKEGDFVFCQADGRPMNPDSIRKRGIYPALERAGVPIEKRQSGCHAFRHLAGSIVHRETGSLKLAQMLLGHSNISTTGDVYTHVDDAEMETVAEILSNAIGVQANKTCGRSVVETGDGATVVH